MTLQMHCWILDVPSGERRVMSNRSETALDSMVIPRSCSSSLESRNRSLPAIREEMMLLEDRSESAKEVLPWSTWATIVTFWTVDEQEKTAGNIEYTSLRECSEVVLRIYWTYRIDFYWLESCFKTSIIFTDSKCLPSRIQTRRTQNKSLCSEPIIVLDRK